MKRSTLFLLLTTGWIVLTSVIHFNVTSLETPGRLAVVFLVGVALFVAHTYFRETGK